MLLNAVWGGQCSPVATLPHDYDVFLQFMGVPLVFLRRIEPMTASLTVYPEATELALGMSLGDVLHHELGLSVPLGAMVVVLNAAADEAEHAPAQLLAAVLQAVIAQGAVPLPLSLCVWAFASLAEAGLAGGAAGNIAALHKVLGYPTARATLSFEAYLQLLEPGFTLRQPDSSLSARLSAGENVSQWLMHLQLAFDHAAERDLAQS